MYYLQRVTTFQCENKLDFEKKARQFYQGMALAWALSSHFHMKITVSARKRSHEDFGPCYLHLPIFFLYIPFLLKNKKLARSPFFSAN